MGTICVVVKIMVPFWVLSIVRHLVFRGPKRGGARVLIAIHLDFLAHEDSAGSCSHPRPALSTILTIEIPFSLGPFPEAS